MLAYFTVVTKSYLPYARVLMSRLWRINRAAKLYVFLADHIDGMFEPDDEIFAVIQPEEYVDVPMLRKMAFQYDAFELCNALRGFAHGYLYRSTDHELWFYYDSDIYPLESPLPVLNENENAAVYLTPHCLQPCPKEMLELELAFLRFGVFNSGWMGVRRSEESRQFIEWFTVRLEQYSFNEYRNCFVDQLWLNLAYINLPGIHMVRHPGANVGYWNLHERRIERDGDSHYRVNGAPVLFVHFSGWSAEEPEIVTRNGPVKMAPAAWTELAKLYSAELTSAGLREARQWQYSWGSFTDGAPISPTDRRRFVDLSLSCQWPAGSDPFACSGILRAQQSFRKRLSKLLSRHR